MKRILFKDQRGLQWIYFLLNMKMITKIFFLFEAQTITTDKFEPYIM